MDARAPRRAQDAAHWFRVDEFPLTGSGKIQKFRLLEQWTSGDVVPLDPPDD